MTNFDGSVRFIGQGEDLLNRVWEHQAGVGSRFTALHGCDRLVWLERHSDRLSAFMRAQDLQVLDEAAMSALIAQLNPCGEDLSIWLTELDLLKPEYSYAPERLPLDVPVQNTESIAPVFTPHLSLSRQNYRLAS